MTANQNYEQINDDIDILEQKLNKISRSIVNYDKTKLIPERERILKSVTKDLTWAKNQVDLLKHDILSCSKEHEAELSNKLSTLTNQATQCESMIGIRQRKFDKQQGNIVKKDDEIQLQDINLDEATTQQVAARGFKMQEESKKAVSNMNQILGKTEDLQIDTLKMTQQ